MPITGATVLLRACMTRLICHASQSTCPACL